MSVDNELLNKSKQDNSAAQAGDLREARRGGNPDENSSQSASDTNESSGPRSLREAVLQKKRENAQEDQENTGGKVSATVSKPISQRTSELLRWAWEHFIDSSGLTLIWINIHVFLNKVLGEKIFCNLGEEWQPLKFSPDASQEEIIKAEMARKSAGLIETMGCACLDLLVLFIIIFLFSLIAMMLGVIENPLRAVSAALGYLWNNFKTLAN